MEIRKVEHGKITRRDINGNVFRDVEGSAFIALDNVKVGTGLIFILEADNVYDFYICNKFYFS